MSTPQGLKMARQPNILEAYEGSRAQWEGRDQGGWTREGGRELRDPEGGVGQARIERKYGRQSVNAKSEGRSRGRKEKQTEGVTSSGERKRPGNQGKLGLLEVGQTSGPDRRERG